jgi:hypothetical protein
MLEKHELYLAADRESLVDQGMQQRARLGFGRLISGFSWMENKAAVRFDQKAILPLSNVL